MWKNKKDLYFYFTGRSVLANVFPVGIGSTFKANAVIFVSNVLHMDIFFVKSQ